MYPQGILFSVTPMAITNLTFQNGDVIFREGDPPGTAYLIESGKIEVSICQGEARIVLSFLGAGDLLGEMAVLDDAPRSAQARAIETSVLTPIKSDQIHERLNEADPIIRALMGNLLHRYRSGLSAARGEPAPLPGIRETGNSGVLAQAKLGDQAVNKFRLERQLIDAIEADELTVVFQPLFCVRDQRVVGFEALTRWSHPERGNISPAEFIALAEETSLILPVGQYALRKSCQALRDLTDQFPNSFVAVNISARQSALPDFAEMLVQEAKAAGVAPSRIELEITESLTLDYRSVRELIDHCHALGIQVSLDDFGTGFSNLGHLHELAFDIVKLDQAFTRQMLISERCFELVRSIINLIHSVGARVIAEGVETPEQARALRDLGVEYLQGWFIGKPVSADQMRAFLERQAPPGLD
jgi:diguanylate cyclase